MENFITYCYYLKQNNKDVNIDNVIDCIEKLFNINQIKKIYGLNKTLRSSAIFEILNFYCFYDENKNINDFYDKDVISDDSKSQKNP